MTNQQIKPKTDEAKRPSARKTSGKRRPSAINTNRLKTTLVVGGLLATYLGADLLASSNITVADNSEPQQVAQIIEIPGSTAAEGFTLQLDPIIDVVSADQIPKAVTKSRSSQ
ncbi:MAG: hypothetical protein ACI9EW_003407 [Cellvibrionaceae bacterium]|jgi:hypothetical protein